MVLRPRRFLPPLLLSLVLATVLVAVPAVAHAADSLSWTRTYFGPRDIPDPVNGDILKAGGLNAVSFSDASNGYAVGVRVDDLVAGTRKGLFAVTSNGGSSWTSGTVGTNLELNGVTARASGDVWAVGSGGTIAHYNGFTWSTQTVPSWPTTRALRAVAFYEGSPNGWAVGDGYGVVKTTDGGATWSVLVAPTSSTSTYRAVTAISGTRALAVGDAGKTRRLGTVDTSPTVGAPSGDLYGVTFRDASNAWAVGNDSTFVRTGDGGATWTKIASPAPPAPFGATELDARAVSFASALEGVAVGTYQMVWRTADGGATWQAEQLYDSETDGTSELRGVAFADSADHPVTVSRAYGLTLTSHDKARVYLGAWADRTPPPPVAPSAPTNVTIADGGAPAPRILVSWTDTAADEDGFVVERSQVSAAGPYSSAATPGANSGVGLVSLPDTGVDLVSTWYYRVRSYRGALSSAWAYATPSGLKLDTTPPVTTSNAVASYSESATIAFSASDGGSGVQHTFYTVDGGPELEGGSVRVTGAGAHTVEFWSEDYAGNAEGHNSASFTITIPDRTAPVTTSDAVLSYVSGATIRLTATDEGGSGVAHTYYRRDGGVQTSGATITFTTIGPHTLEFWSVDGAGNTESPHHTWEFEVTAPQVIDTTDPITTSDAEASYVGSAVIHLDPTDNVGVKNVFYILDGGTQVSGNYTISISGVGSHTLEFWAVDFADNVEDPHKTATFEITAPPVIDSIAPVTTSDAKTSYVGTATIKLSATDNIGVTGTYYRLDGGAQVPGTTVTVSSVGAHTLEFWSQDAAGNPETHKTASFTVAAVPALPVATTLSLKSSSTSTRRNKYITLTSTLKGGVPAGSHVRYQARYPGKKSYSILTSTRDVSASGIASYRYKLTKKGTYYFQSRFLGIRDGLLPSNFVFMPSNSKGVKVVVR